MPFLDDFVNAVSDYPTANVVLSIEDRAPVPPATPGAVNVNEVWSFQVRVRNNGHLNMTGVSLHIAGDNGVQVGTAAAGPFSAGAITFGNLTLNGHGGQQDTANLFFKAPPGIKPAGRLVRAHIGTFDVNLNDILLNHSGHATAPEGIFTAEIFP